MARVETGWNKITQALIGQSKNLLYSKSNGMPLEDFKQDNYITCFMFLKEHFDSCESLSKEVGATSKCPL